jgi:preprotein translocase subunit SecG
MKNEHRTYWLGWVFILLALYLVHGCSGKWHFERAQQKGLILETINDTLIVRDTIKGKDGKDSIIYKTEQVIKYSPKYITRWKVRFDNNRFNDSLKHYRLISEEEKKYNLKEVESNNKASVSVKNIENKNTWKDKLTQFSMIVLVVLVIILTLLHILKSR